jgi:hypothetical protein
MAELSLAEQHDLVASIADFQSLHALDLIWTGQFEGNAPPRIADLSLIRQITDEMDALLARSVTHAELLRTIFESHSDLVERAGKKLLSELEDRPKKSVGKHGQATWHGDQPCRRCHGTHC